MKDENKTKEQFITELSKLRQRIKQLEASEAERKQAEKLLRNSKEFIETVFNNINDSISVIDTTNYGIIGINRAF